MTRKGCVWTFAALVLALPARPLTAQTRNVADLTVKTPAEVLPPDFRGEIRYKGTYQGLARASFSDPRVGGQELPMAGSYAMTIRFDGHRIEGSTETENGVLGLNAALEPGSFTGTRFGATCSLQWQDGSTTTDYCSRTELREVVNDDSKGGDHIEYVVRAVAQQAVDAGAPPPNAATPPARTLATLQAAAQSGDIPSLRALAQAYRNGTDGAPRDPAQAAIWYEKAARAGDGWSAGMVGMMYMDGLDLQADPVKGHGFLLDCARSDPARMPDKGQIITTCMITLANSFTAGLGAEKSESEGLNWFRKCASKGDLTCINWLSDRDADKQHEVDDQRARADRP